jgi:hypothetical protein
VIGEVPRHRQRQSARGVLEGADIAVAGDTRIAALIGRGASCRLTGTDRWARGLLGKEGRRAAVFSERLKLGLGVLQGSAHAAAVAGVGIQAVVAVRDHHVAVLAAGIVVRDDRVGEGHDAGAAVSDSVRSVFVDRVVEEIARAFDCNALLVAVGDRRVGDRRGCTMLDSDARCFRAREGRVADGDGPEIFDLSV